MAEREATPDAVVEPQAAASTPSPGAATATATAAADSSPISDPGTGLLPAGYWGQQALEVDDDADSAFGAADAVSSSASLTSNILQYRTIQGRTFHSDQGSAQYWGSNDELQSEALDITHHVLTLLLDGQLFLAPLRDDIQAAIDIGTGTGLWAIDFADEFPGARVIGTDISPIQPNWVPPNLSFHIDDCTQEWTFEHNSTDFIHLRWLVGSVADWDYLMRQTFRTLKPGGYVESHEGSVTLTSDDGTVHDTTAISQWGRFFIEGGHKLERSFTLVEDGVIKAAMEAAGFVDIHVRDYKCPVGGWARDPKLAEVGTYMRLAFDQDAEGAVLFMASLQGWKREEVLVYVAQLRREMASLRYHTYFRTQVVYGRKPGSAS